MTLRLVALALAVALAIPAALILLRPGRAAADRTGPPARRRLDLVWAAVPIVLLAALIALTAAA
jgi:heme/copper-type cytochrome/quinol oxidase subunit 2